MRLIDADKLLNKIDAYMCGSQDVMFVKELIKEQPTAFDVEKVVSELEKSHFHTDATFDDDGYCNDDSEEVVNLNEAIEIIKRGVIDEVDN